VSNKKRKNGRAPFGFRYDPDNSGKLVPSGKEISLAQKVIKIRYGGAGYGEISSKTGLTKMQVKRILEKKNIYS
jgi:DNA invertase Pin-like site-specific DNA recombinase